MHEVTGSREAFQSLGEQGRARWNDTTVVDTRFIQVVVLAEHRVPVHQAEQRPGGDGPDVDTGRTKAGCSIPGFEQPTDLFIRIFTAEMSLGEHHRPLIAIPGLTKPRQPSRFRCFKLDPARLGIRVGLPCVAAMKTFRIQIKSVIEEPVARHVVVDADQVRCGFSGRQLVKMAGIDAGRLKDAAPGMGAVDQSAKQVEA